MKYERTVSVIMGVYNQSTEEILRKAVCSILNQSVRDFEFIIYDDGSEEKSSSYIKALKDMDERITIINAAQNNGLAFSLNACIAVAKGKYIARMDADDISHPERFAEQVEFLDKHPEYQWCGCNAEIFDNNGIWGQRKMPECPQKKDFLKYSPYVHPSVMYRAELFSKAGMYKVSRETLRCEDYEIFMRFHELGYRGYNIQKNLFYYREDHESYNKRKLKYRISEMKIRYRNFKKMKMLFPKGWVYVIRPIVGAVVPNRLISLIKRRKDEHEKSGQVKPLPEDIVARTNIPADNRQVQRIS